jgi:hypothetical protein
MIAHKERKEECKMRRRHLFDIVVFASVLTMLLGGSVYAVSNGQPDLDNNWPYVGLVVVDEWDGTDIVPMWRGTGALISPTVVLTAGHLTENALAARIWFDVGPIQGFWEDPPGHYPYPGPDSVEAKEIHTHPDYESGVEPELKDWISHDVGILILKKRVRMDEYGELPEEDLVDMLQSGTVVDQVGYGVQEMHRGGGQPYWTGVKMRYFAPAELIASSHVFGDEFMKLTANPAQGKGGTCFGDSGGPNLLGETNTILGVTSWGTNYECAGVSYAQRIDTADVLNWIYSFLE